MSNHTSSVTVRLAGRSDVEFILQMIKELASYEQALEQVKGTTELLEKWLFEQPVAECLIASLDGADRGIALFFTNFSTWESKPGVFLEDLVVQQEARGHGLGTALFCKLAQLVLERGYTRLEWNCLDWNEPSLKFYESLGAIARTDWIPHRLELDALERLAQQPRL